MKTTNDNDISIGEEEKDVGYNNHNNGVQWRRKRRQRKKNKRKKDKKKKKKLNKEVLKVSHPPEIRQIYNI